MAIRQRGDAWMVDVAVRGNRVTTTCKTKHEANIKESDIRALLLRGNTADAVKRKLRGEADAPPKAGRKTLGDAHERTCRIWSGTGGEKSARINAQSALTYFGKDIPLTEITTSLVDDYVAHLEDDGLSNATINRKIAALSKMLTAAVDREWLVKKPKMERKKEGVGRIRWITEQEEDDLLAHLTSWDALDQRDAIMVLLDTGVRTGELFRIEGRDVDLKNRTLSIWVTKADLPRTVPLTARSWAILKDRLEVHTAGRLFPFTKWWLRNTWDRARNCMGLGDDAQFVPHACRHTCASRLVQAGVGITVVQQWLGHKQITITMRYAHLAPKNLAQVVHVLERHAPHGQGV